MICFKAKSGFQNPPFPPGFSRRWVSIPPKEEEGAKEGGRCQNISLPVLQEGGKNISPSRCLEMRLSRPFLLGFVRESHIPAIVGS